MTGGANTPAVISNDDARPNPGFRELQRSKPHREMFPATPISSRKPVAGFAAEPPALDDS